ncbi:hypothetical protein GCM10009798_38640 [Nocardioides panacihumi]|uniref:Uncharacterized protein n=1 Tax=Nocardioides panacihumi TaxID=400774 RepID=A0ABN2RRM7_9ACTN
MKPQTLATIQNLLAVVVGILSMSHWANELPLFPAMVLNVGGIVIALALIRAATRGLRWLRRPSEQRDPLAAWHRR